MSVSPGLQNDETFLTVNSARITRATPLDRLNSSRLSPQMLSPRILGKTNQGTQLDRIGSDVADKKQSYGSIAGLDPNAVVEIEHLIQSQASGRGLPDASKKDISTRAMGSGDLTHLISEGKTLGEAA